MTPILSICIPTNGAAQWVMSTLNSIYSQDCDITLFEVVIADNGTSSDLHDELSKLNYPNLSYYKTEEKGFQNLITCLKYGKGLYCKMLNHRSKLLPGIIDHWIELIKAYSKEQPILFFCDGYLGKKETMEYNDLDSFLQRLSIWASWSGGIGIWKSDICRLDAIEFNEMFPNASLLFEIRPASKHVIYNLKFQEMQDDSGKGGYDLFKTFFVDFLDIISILRIKGQVTIDTFIKVKKDLIHYMDGYYYSDCIRKSNHTFIIKNVRESVLVYYSAYDYFLFLCRAYFVYPLKHLAANFLKILK